MKLLVLIAISLTLPGCIHVADSVKPLTISDTEPDNDASRCALLQTYELANEECRPVLPDGNEESNKQLIMRRNELTHRLMGESTSLCAAYKNQFSNKARSSINKLESVAILFAAAASAVTISDLTRGLTGAASAAQGISGILDNQSVDDIDTAMQGIEYERTRIAKQILKHNDDTILRYPVSRAINDVIRYHSVCNVIDGRNAVSNIMGETIEDSKP